MQDEIIRTAFTFAPILRHRTTDAARRITAVALDTTAGRVFIGLASGNVEEHEIVLKQVYVLDASQPAPGLHATTRLVAEKRVSKQPVTTLTCLPTAARLAILCEDGMASVASYDTWTVTALHGVRTAVAIAADPAPASAVATARRAADLANAVSGNSSAGIATSKPRSSAVAVATYVPSPRPVRLAVAVKSITTAAKLLIYSIAPSIGIAAGQPPAHLLAQISMQDAVQGLTWVGAGLFVQHASSYNLLQPGGRVTQIAEHGCAQPRMTSAPWPTGPVAEGDGASIATTASGGTSSATARAARGALLFQDALILLTDGNGAAVVGSEPIPVSDPPLALCSSGAFLVLISDAEGVLVYDRTSSRLVQRIFWAHDDPWVTAAGCIPVAEDAGGGGGVAVATSNTVLLLQPVLPDVQARELLKRKRFDAALAVIRSHRRAGEVWADTALAQAGLLMLQELRCEDALVALEEVGPAIFQPAQLLPLFPRICRRWLQTLPHRNYWGLHGSLQSLDRICDDFLELRNSTTSSPRPSPSPPASQQGVRAGGAATTMSAAAAIAAAQLLVPPVVSSDANAPVYQGSNHSPHHHHHQLHRIHHQHHHPWPLTDESPSPASSAVVGGGGGGEVAALAADAKRHIVSYLLRNRSRPGVVCLEGIDTLLAHLLVDTGDTAALEAFLDTRGQPQQGHASAVANGNGTQALGLSAATPSALPALGGTSLPLMGSGRVGLPEVTPEVAAATAGALACVSPRDAALVAALQGAGRWHALALLLAARGQVAQVLELWQRLALREVVESRTSSGAVAAAVAAITGHGAHDPLATTKALLDGAFSGCNAATTAADHSPGDDLWGLAAAGVAAEAAARLMALPARTPPLLCLSKLPWLLQAAPDWALYVLRSRPLPVVDVMSLLQGRCDGVRWQYLHHLVYTGAASPQLPASLLAALPPIESGNSRASVESAEEQQPLPPDSEASAALAPAAETPVAWHLDPALHTELALEVIECIGLLQARQIQQRRQQEAQGMLPGQLQDSVGEVTPLPAASEARDESPVELPPPLPPLPVKLEAISQLSTCHEGGVGGGITTAMAIRACSPPSMPMTAAVTAVQSRQSSTAPFLPAQTQYASDPRQLSHHHHHHHHHQPTSHGRTQASQPYGHGHGHQPTASRAPQSATDVGSGAHGSTGVPSNTCAGGGGRYVSGGRGACAAAAGAAAAAATAASAVSTSELAWLGTLGVLTAEAVARQLSVAMRAARLAAGQDVEGNLETHMDLSAASLSTSATAISPSIATLPVCLGDSLSLLRALSLRGNGGGAGTLTGLRAVLQHHLYCSTLYDAGIVIQALSNGDGGAGSSNGGGSGGGGGLSALLLLERVQLYCRLEDHTAALALLALQLQDVDSAICYCRARCGQEGWLALLDLLLRPGPGLEPDYAAACRVLAAEGAALAPLQVLEALSDNMPLHLAHGTLSRMLGSVLHRKRHGQVLRALHRAQNLAQRAELAELQARQVVVTDETLCRGCQRPLATQVFYRYPSGVVLCARCIRPPDII